MDVQAVARRAYGHAAGPESAPCGRGVDALCQTAHHHGSAGGQTKAQLFRAGNAVGRTVAGAHHRYAEQIVQQRQLTFVVEQSRWIVDVFQPSGIGGVGKGQKLNIQPLTVGKNFVSRGEIMVFQ